MAELKAVNSYITNMQANEQNNLNVEKSGLIINPAYTFLGASQDSVIHGPVSVDNSGLLEITAP